MALVYSTDGGRTCPSCRKPIAACTCAAEAAASPRGDGHAGRVRVSREKRNGKLVTFVRGLPLADAELSVWGKRLRQSLAAGGTAKDGVLEVQGDHVERVLAWLQQEGVAAKRSGG